MPPQGVALCTAFVEIFTLHLKWQIPTIHGVLVAHLQCNMPSQHLLQVMTTTLFLFSVFCHSQSSLQCIIACNLHRTMLIEMHVTFHYVISTTLKRHSLHEFLMPLHDLPPPAFQPLIHCGLCLTPFLFKDYAYENLLFKIPKLHCITIRPSSNQSQGFFFCCHAMFGHSPLLPSLTKGMVLSICYQCLFW